MQSKFSIVKRVKSFKFAFKGIKFLLNTQHNARIHVFMALLVIVFGIIFPLKATEWIMLIFAMGFVFCAEAFNTALELLVDKVSPERNKTAGRIKDLAAGAVLLAAITAATIGLIVFIPKIF